MRKQGKLSALGVVQKLYKVHDDIRQSINNKAAVYAMQLLSDCQQSAIELGSLIEQTEGEGFVTVKYIEDYCELLYNNYQALDNAEEVNSNKVYKVLRKYLVQIENSIRNDISVKLEAVFLPYKASMWDSLESIWKAADADPDCDAYVVPIPYYDKNPDGSYKKEHYEGGLYPDYVPITRFDEYDIAKRHPDIIFIHNPYDNNNLVTSVHPDFFSDKLKKCTELLVYVPYYSTSGSMGEARRSCPAYYNADYIIMQAEKYRSYFDASLPEKKLLPFGSPKFDRVINICKNPPVHPAEWEEKMAGKKVYFYNTSIGGLLGNTENYLKKMAYVFKCFEGRKDACLVWRPHPLLETTLDSMRQAYKKKFLQIKEYFINNNIGIYDETPDVTNTIALCDAYVGDGSSVVSLFGVVGKPVFMLDTNINTEPDKDDWKGSIISDFPDDGDNEWIIVSGNKLYHSKKCDYEYEYYCDLSEYTRGYHYSHVIKVNGKNYVCPANANDILVVDNNKIVDRIELNIQIESAGAFYDAIKSENYLFLLPYRYPAIVRYDTVNGRLDYLDKNDGIVTARVNGQVRFGAVCERNGYIYIGSSADNRVLAIEATSFKTSVFTISSEKLHGCLTMKNDGNDIWITPYSGGIVVCWNPDTGCAKEYDCSLEGLECINPYLGLKNMDKPFGCGAFYKEYVYLTPYWGNKYVKINKLTGEVTEWFPPFKRTRNAINGYFTAEFEGKFLCMPDEEKNKRECLLFSAYDRKIYDVDFETNECTEVQIQFNQKQLEENTAGFSEWSEWMMYACAEDAFNSLPDFLNGNITGNQFNRDRQLKAYSKIVANYDGTSGEKIYNFMRDKLN